MLKKYVILTYSYLKAEDDKKKMKKQLDSDNESYHYPLSRAYLSYRNLPIKGAPFHSLEEVNITKMTIYIHM